MKFSYFDEYESRFFPTVPKCFLISGFCGLQEQLSSRLLFLKFISRNIASKFGRNVFSNIEQNSSVMGIFNKLIRTTKPIYLKLSSCKKVIKLTFSYQKHVDITSHCLFQEIKLILQRINIKLSYYDAFMFFSFMSLRLLNCSFF